MNPGASKQAVRWFIALVWICNGLGAKVLGLVPRHEAIVERILGTSFSAELTVLFGLGEIAICVWFLSGKWQRWNAILQMCLIVSMNLLEFAFASDLLLWGRFNLVFAMTFVGIIYLYEFRMKGV